MKNIFVKKTFIISLLILVVFGVAFGGSIKNPEGVSESNSLIQSDLLCHMDNTNDLWYDEED